MQSYHSKICKANYNTVEGKKKRTIIMIIRACRVLNVWSIHPPNNNDVKVGG